MPDIWTKSDYEEYKTQVEKFFEREGITNLSPIDDKEAYFSWRSCDCCHSSAGNTLQDCNGYNPTSEQIQEYSICEGCIYYTTYGQLDDMTMMRLEKLKTWLYIEKHLGSKGVFPLGKTPSFKEICPIGLTLSARMPIL